MVSLIIKIIQFQAVRGPDSGNKDKRMIEKTISEGKWERAGSLILSDDKIVELCYEFICQVRKFFKKPRIPTKIRILIPQLIEFSSQKVRGPYLPTLELNERMGTCWATIQSYICGQDLLPSNFMTDEIFYPPILGRRISSSKLQEFIESRKKKQQNIKESTS